MDLNALLTPEAASFAGAVWVITFAFKRSFLPALKYGLAPAWFEHWRRFALTLLPLALGVAGGALGFIGGESWQDRVTLGVIASGVAMLSHQTIRETSRAIAAQRGGER